MWGKRRQGILTREMHKWLRALYSYNLAQITSDLEELCYVRYTDVMTDFGFSSKSMCINWSPTPSASSLSDTLWGNINNLNRFDKNLKLWSYLKYGFTSAVINDEPHPKHTLCLEILPNDRMNPSQFKN